MWEYSTYYIKSEYCSTVCTQCDAWCLCSYIKGYNLHLSRWWGTSANKHTTYLHCPELKTTYFSQKWPVFSHTCRGDREVGSGIDRFFAMSGFPKIVWLGSDLRQKFLQRIPNQTITQKTNNYSPTSLVCLITREENYS